MQNMIDFLNGIKILLVGTLASAGVIVGSINPIGTSVSPIASTSAFPVQSIAKPASSSSEFIKIAQVQEQLQPVVSPSPSNAASTPLPLNGENYLYAQGTYSYLGQKLEYLFLIPKKGGSFSGSIKGACQAQVGAVYAGGEGGEVKGKAGGECKIFFVSYKGSTDFTGRLYQQQKLLEIEIPNSPLKGPIKLNYNVMGMKSI